MIRGLKVIWLVEVSGIHVTRSSAVLAPGPLFENGEPDVWKLDLGRILFLCFSKQSQRLTEVSGRSWSGDTVPPPATVINEGRAFHESCPLKSYHEALTS